MFVWRVTVQLQSWKCWKYWRMIRFLFFFYSSHSPSSAVLLMLEYFVVFEYFPMTPYAFILILVWMSVIISDDINNKNKNEWSYNIAESFTVNDIQSIRSYSHILHRFCCESKTSHDMIFIMVWMNFHNQICSKGWRSDCKLVCMSMVNGYLLNGMLVWTWICSSL